MDDFVNKMQVFHNLVVPVKIPLNSYGSLFDVKKHGPPLNP
jgi:hypothetical protein